MVMGLGDKNFLEVFWIVFLCLKVDPGIWQGSKVTRKTPAFEALETRG